MKLKTRRMMALLIALVLLLGMATTSLAKETYSKPIDLSDHIKRPIDDNQEPPEAQPDDPVDPEETEVAEEPTDPGEATPVDPTDPDEDDLPPAEEPADPEEGDQPPVEEPSDPEEGDQLPEEEPGDPDEDDLPPTEDPTPGTVITEDEGGSLNLRETPDPSGAIITTIPSGATLTIIRHEGDWILVEYEGIQGYVSAQYVSEAEVEEEAPVPEEPIERNAHIYADKDPGALYLGDSLNMWVELTGYEGVDVSAQWQTRSEDGDWSDISGATELSYSVTITEDNAGHSWRAKISASD